MLRYVCIVIDPQLQNLHKNLKLMILVIEFVLDKLYREKLHIFSNS